MSTGGTATALLTATVARAPRRGVEPEDAKDLRHHLKDGKGFVNPWDSWRELGTLTIGWGLLKRRFVGQANVPKTAAPTVTVRKPVLLEERFGRDSLRATWLGHACYLVEFPSGFRVLFDPVFTARCSPFSMLGPKRFTELPCEIEDIPIVDAVVISHNHYDHLSHPTVVKIGRRHPHAHFFVPLKNKQWFLDCGIERVTELDWWEDAEIALGRAPSSLPEDKAPKIEMDLDRRDQEADGPSAITARIGCLPCQHISARTAFDRAHALWASWSIESGGKKVWFAGDTGYRAVPELSKGVDDYAPDQVHPRCPAFKQIGDLRGPFDLGLIPIGAYEPRWIMSPMHANPFDSVHIFIDTRCERALGMHWGTWVLTEEDVLEPPALLKTALKRTDLAEEGVFDVCDIGESREF